MPRYAQFVVGPAGCGKSTYCATIQKHCESTHRPCRVINLDPAAEYFAYTPSADIREFIQVDDVMECINMGPNGGLIFCMEQLCIELGWIDEMIGEDELDYILFDCPGQIELYSHLTIFPQIIEHLQRKWDFRIVSVFILDARFLVDGSHFLSGILSALSAMVCLRTPHVNVMTKMDMLSENKQKLVCARYLEPDVRELCESSEQEENKEDTSTSHKKPRKFVNLSCMLADVINRYSLVRFQPLNKEEEESIEDLLFVVDQCIQYGEDNEPMNRFFDEADREMTGYSHNQTVGRLPFTAAVIAVVTAVLYLVEFVVRQTSQVLESHERLKWLVLLVETLAHAFTGAVFWLVASLELPEPKSYRLMIFSTCLASLGAIVVDIDHFIAAGSLSIKAARSLLGRPFLHWTGGLMLLLVLLLISGYIVRHFCSTSPYLLRLVLVGGWVILVSWTSHQMRDALRRGLWLWPPPSHLLSPPEYHSTPPLPLPLSYPLALITLLVPIHFIPEEIFLFSGREKPIII
ncbi:unnamed protein product [Hymenolepis diminuta]|uniref:GPN-loop GTPase 3 n=1 Tax=Hymenolepis diminuta TaxID=6216 RepID=A0A0R3SEX6_HYMDI|nr:unnamed protein product [Hymenolepis diminuta]